MFAHFLCETTHADTGEVIDCETGVALVGVVHGEDAVEAGAEDVVFEARLESSHTHCFREVLEEDLDENTAAGGGFVFVQVDN